MSQGELRPRTVTLGLYEHVIDCTCPFGESEEFTDMLWSQGVYPDCGLMEQIAVTSWCHQGCFLGFLFFFSRDAAQEQNVHRVLRTHTSMYVPRTTKYMPTKWFIQKMKVLSTCEVSALQFLEAKSWSHEMWGLA